MATEKRLIDANPLIEHLVKCKTECKGIFGSVCVAIKCFVEQMPTVDAVEVVHGRWIPCTNGGYHCSVCDKRFGFVFDNNYCPNCGAKMDGGNGDG